MGKSRTGCSRTAILKFIREKYNLGDEKKATTNLKLALKRGIVSGTLKMSRTEGKNSHKFKLGDNATVTKPKKVNLGAKEKKPKKKVVKPVSKGKAIGVKKVAKLNKGNVTVPKKSTSKLNKGKGTVLKKSTSKKPTSKLSTTSKVKSGAKGAKKVLKKTIKK